MSDTIRCRESLSPMFSRGNPTQRPNECCGISAQRAFGVSAVVNRSSLRAHKERTDVRVCQGSPGAWLVGVAYSDAHRLEPLTGTLGHLLSSPARRIARSLVGLPPVDAEASAVSPPIPEERESGGKREKAKICSEEFMGRPVNERPKRLRKIMRRAANRPFHPQRHLLIRKMQLTINATPSEKRVRTLLEDLGYRHQFQRGFLAGGVIYVADFYLPKPLWLVIEIDGKYHESPKQREKDAERDKYFFWRGFRVLRIKNEEADVMTAKQLNSLIIQRTKIS